MSKLIYIKTNYYILFCDQFTFYYETGLASLQPATGTMGNIDAGFNLECWELLIPFLVAVMKLSSTAKRTFFQSVSS